MSKQRGNRTKRNKPTVGDKSKQLLENFSENNPVYAMFKEFSIQLDTKHDKYERIVKISRDITTESKRVIFLLHNTNSDIESKKNQVIEEAEKRLDVLVDTSFRTIAQELRNEDSYQYLRAYTSGLQEFIEAVAFCEFIKNDGIKLWYNLNEMFKYKDDTGSEFSLLFPQYEFVLGLADFTGELMRRCINTLGIGNTDECFKLCRYVRDINTGFLGLISPSNKEIFRKAYVLRQSLTKMELVCYNIQIRGSEIPKHMLAAVIDSNEQNTEDDEGFF